eukprot:m.271480 g.271480  ORF g.271480 m.271480 type:complete len:245 (-) comp53126_c0_seq1:19-753(-)
MAWKHCIFNYRGWAQRNPSATVFNLEMPEDDLNKLQTASNIYAFDLQMATPPESVLELLQIKPFVLFMINLHNQQARRAFQTWLKLLNSLPTKDEDNLCFRYAIFFRSASDEQADALEEALDAVGGLCVLETVLETDAEAPAEFFEWYHSLWTMVKRCQGRRDRSKSSCSAEPVVALHSYKFNKPRITNSNWGKKPAKKTKSSNDMYWFWLGVLFIALIAILLHQRSVHNSKYVQYSRSSSSIK